MQSRLFAPVIVAFVSGLALGGGLGYFAAGKGDGRASATSSERANVLERLGSQAAEQKKGLPKQVDAETQWFDVTVGPGIAITYWYRLVNYNGEALDSGKFRANVEPGLIRRVCAEGSMRKDLDQGAVYRFDYVGKDRIKVAEIEIDRRKCTR